MKKTLSFAALLTGIVAVVYALNSSVSTAIFTLQSISSFYEGQYWDYFTKFLLDVYSPVLTVGFLLCVLGGLFLWLNRRSAALEGMYGLMLMGYGAMLVCLPVLEASCDALYTKSLIRSWIDPSIPLGVYMWDRFFVQLGIAVLGILYLILGIIAWYCRRGRKSAAQPEPRQDGDIPEDAGEEVDEIKKQEAIITLFGTVVDIRGDYALIKYEDTGIVSEVAIALLPFGIDTGDRLKYENYEFEMV